MFELILLLKRKLSLLLKSNYELTSSNFTPAPTERQKNVLKPVIETKNTKLYDNRTDNCMLLEDYEYTTKKYVNRCDSSAKRYEDKYKYGYELYRPGVSSSHLMQLCIGSYGYKSEYDAVQDACRCVQKMFGSNYSTIYAKVYELDINRVVKKDTVNVYKFAKDE